MALMVLSSVGWGGSESCVAMRPYTAVEVCRPIQFTHTTSDLAFPTLFLSSICVRAAVLPVPGAPEMYMERFSPEVLEEERNLVIFVISVSRPTRVWSEVEARLCLTAEISFALTGSEHSSILRLSFRRGELIKYSEEDWCLRGDLLTASVEIFFSGDFRLKEAVNSISNFLNGDLVGMDNAEVLSFNVI